MVSLYQPFRVVVFGDTCVSEQGLATIGGATNGIKFCGGGTGFLWTRATDPYHRPEFY